MERAGVMLVALSTESSKTERLGCGGREGSLPFKADWHSQDAAILEAGFVGSRPGLAPNDFLASFVSSWKGAVWVTSSPHQIESNGR